MFRKPLFAQLMLLAAIVPVYGQSRQTPPKPPGRHADEAVEDAAREKQQDLQKAVERAYRAWAAAEEPRLILLCGMPWSLAEHVGVRRVDVSVNGPTPDGQNTTIDPTPAQGNTSPVRIQGSLSPFRHIGTDLTFRDHYGFTQGLTSQIEKNFRRGKIDNWVDADALIEHRARLVTALQQANERDALASIFAESAAALALYIRVDPVVADADTDPKDGPKVRVIVQIKQPESGASIYADTFTGSLGSAPQFVAQYGDRLTASLAEGLADYFEQRESGQRYRVKIAGAQPGQCLTIKEVCKAQIPAIKLFRIDRDAPPAGGMADLEIRYAGDAFGLVAALQRTLAQQLGLEVGVTDAVAGALTLTLRALPETPVETNTRWQTLYNANAPGHAEALAELKAKYVTEGRPSIAVIINRELSDAEKRGVSDAALKQAQLDPATARAGRLVVWAPPPGDASPDRAALDTAKAQNLLTGELLNQYDFVVRDAQMARKLLSEAASREGDLFEDHQLQSLITRLQGVDLAVRGLGIKVDEGQPHYEYTFDVVNCSNGNILATASESIDARAFVDGADPLARLTRQVAAKLADQLLGRWSPPRRFHVIVQNARSQANVFAVMDAFESQLQPKVGRTDFVSHSTGPQSGVGEFYVEWNGDYRSLVEAVQAKTGVLTFDLEARNTDSSTLAVRIKEGLASAVP